MKIIDFKIENKKYCFEKLDNHNFSIREYLDEPREIVLKGGVYIQEFKTPDNFFGTMEYAVRKAFKLLGKPFINKNEFSLYSLSYKPKNTLFDLRPYDVNDKNIDEVKKLIEKAFNHG